MMGKSSLYTKHLTRLKALGIQCVDVDATAEIGDRDESAARWFLHWLEICVHRVGLDPMGLAKAYAAIDVHTAGVGTVLETLLLNGLLKQTKGRILLILDEYDSIAALPYRDDIITALRHIRARQSLTHAFDRLSLCLVGVLPLHKLIQSAKPGQSLVCTDIIMRDFDNSAATVAALARGFPQDHTPDSAIIREALKLSGGQPLVTVQLLKEALAKRCRTPADLRALAWDLVAVSGSGNDLQIFDLVDDSLEKEGAAAFGPLSAFKVMLENDGKTRSPKELNLLLQAGVLRPIRGTVELKGELFQRRFDIPWAESMLNRLAGSKQLQQYRGWKKSPNRRICLINTGGTLGMVERDKQVVPARDAEEFKAYFGSLDAIARTVEFVDLFAPRDSINVFPDQWAVIAKFIYSKRNQGFDGFVVAHGTDTMAYTASAVAFALGRQLRFPVVFTGAQTTPDVPYGDAHVNLYRACEVAKQPIHEVVISFGNFVYRAVRAQKRDDRRFDGFESPTYPPLAEITGEINVRSELLRPLPRRKADIVLRARFERSILIVPQFPGLEPGFFSDLLNDVNSDTGCRGVIIQTLGAGNVTSDDPYSFIPFVQRAYRREIPVIVTSQYPPDPGSHTKYTPAQAPIKAGAIHAGNMTLAAAVTKFRWVLADVRTRRDWDRLNRKLKRALVAKLMVENPSYIGEF